MDGKEVEYPKVYMYRRIVAAKTFMDENYAEKLDLSKISNASKFSRFHFIRLFKDAFGLTPHQYLNSVRIDKARISLKAGKSVTDVCFQVGFENISSFSKMFKKKIGIGPQAFQKEEMRARRAQSETPLTYVPSCFANKFR